MARRTEQEKRELLSAGRSLTDDLAEIKRKGRSAFHKRDGTMDYPSLISFLNQINVLLGHPRKPFHPIQGDRFVL
jgi:hypothetical protein